MITTEMQTVMMRLQSDWNFIESFLNDPESALKDIPLRDEERSALTARSTEALLALGWNETAVFAAMSGIHQGSGNCPSLDN